MEYGISNGRSGLPNKVTIRNCYISWWPFWKHLFDHDNIPRHVRYRYSFGQLYMMYSCDYYTSAMSAVGYPGSSGNKSSSSLRPLKSSSVIFLFYYPFLFCESSIVTMPRTRRCQHKKNKTKKNKKHISNKYIT